jgi:hypothetical protein
VSPEKRRGPPENRLREEKETDLQASEVATLGSLEKDGSELSAISAVQRRNVRTVTPIKAAPQVGSSV